MSAKPAALAAWLLLLLLAAFQTVHPAPSRAQCPSIHVDPPSVHFGTVGVGAWRGRVVLISNDGEPGTELHVTTITTTGHGLSHIGPPPPYTLPPDSAVAYSVVARPDSSGTHTGAFTVESDNACNSPAEVALTYVATAPPLCDAGPADFGPPGATLTFDGSGSSDPGGSIVDYAWQFGDGASGEGVIADHVYAAPHDYVVMLTVTDNDAQRSSCTTDAIVSAEPPCDALGPYQALTGHEIVLSGQSALGAHASFAWEFGDGGVASGADVAHAYDVAGLYDVTLTVTASWGESWSCGTSVTVQGAACLSGFPYETAFHYSDQLLEPGASDAAFLPDGHLVVACLGGLAVYELDGGRATRVGALGLGAGGGAICVLGTRAFVVDPDRVLWSIDISVPAQPVLLGTLALPASGAPVALTGSDDALYVGTDTGALVVVDVREPAAPEVAGSMAMDVRSLLADGDLLYAGVAGPDLFEEAGGIRILDIAERLAPVQLSSLDLNRQVTDLALDAPASRLYAAGARADDFEFVLGDVRAIDVTDPAAPVPRYLPAAGTFGWSIHIACLDGVLFVRAATQRRWGSPPPRLWRIGTADGSVQGAELRSEAPKIVAHGNHLVALGGVAGLVEVVHRPVDAYPAVDVVRSGGGGQATQVALYGDHVYWTDVSGLEDPYVRDLVQNLIDGRDARLFWPFTTGIPTGDVMICMGDSLRVFDLAEPLWPVPVGAVDIDGYRKYQRYAVDADLVLVPSLSAMHVVDISEPTAPVRVASYPSPEVLAIARDGERAYLLTETDVEIVDLSTPAAPVGIGQVAGVAGTDMIAAAGGHLYGVDAGAYRMTVHDVGNGADPRQVATLVLPLPSDLVVAGETAYVTTSEGLAIVDVADPAAPRLVGTVSGDYEGTRVAVDGERVVFGDAGTLGFQGWTEFVGAYIVVPARCVENPSPVVLSGLEATAGDGGVHLAWRATGIADLFGFDVFRTLVGAGDAARLNTSPLPPAREAVYFDADVVAGSTYAYRIEAIERSGRRRSLGAVRVRVPPVARLLVGAVRPTPVLAGRELPELSIALPSRLPVRVRAYDTSGRLVRTLVGTSLEAGRHALRWDLRDMRGRDVASGVYFLRIEAGGDVVVRRLVLLR